MTNSDCAFYDAFKDCMDQHPLTLTQFKAYLDGDSDAVPSETYPALADTYNLWQEAQRYSFYGEPTPSEYDLAPLVDKHNKL